MGSQIIGAPVIVALDLRRPVATSGDEKTERITLTARIVLFCALMAAAAFSRVYDEVRNYFRPRQKMGQAVSLGRRRELFIGRYLKLQDQFCVVV